MENIFNNTKENQSFSKDSFYTKILPNKGWEAMGIFLALSDLITSSGIYKGFKYNESLCMTLFVDAFRFEQMMNFFASEKIICPKLWKEDVIVLTHLITREEHNEILKRFVSENKPVKDKDRFERFIDYYNKKLGKRYTTRGWKDKAEKKFLALMETYSHKDFEVVIQNMLDDENVEDKYITPEYVCRIDKFEKYLNSESSKKQVYKGSVV